MEELRLEFPSLKHKDRYQAYKEETLAHGEMFINGDGGCHTFDHYEDWLEEAKKMHLGIDLKEGFVPATTYFLVKEEKVIGCINIRHRLNESLLNFGGHIGYSILPSERKKGYATAMLKMGLLKCKDLGIDPVLVTCDKNNVASRKTIEACGGRFENEWTNPQTGNITLRFWIGGK